MAKVSAYQCDQCGRVQVGQAYWERYMSSFQSAARSIARHEGYWKHTENNYGDTLQFCSTYCVGEWLEAFGIWQGFYEFLCSLNQTMLKIREDEKANTSLPAEEAAEKLRAIRRT